MRKMKDSGVEWIGEIPADWETIKNKYLLKEMYSGGTPSATNDDFYSENGIPFVSISDMSSIGYVRNTKKRVSKEGVADKNLKVLPIGTILYSIYATVGAISELKTEATISQAMLALALNKTLNKEYYKYNLSAMKKHIFSNANGNTQFNLNAEKVSNFIFVFPPLPTQHRIADYLDDKCAKIDAIIAREQSVIEKLKDYKMSVITEAVTKGLNPNVPMKDSGIEWVGKIPEHWGVTILSSLFREQKNKNKGLAENNLLSLSYGKIVRKNISTNEGLLPASFESYNIIEKGHIVFRLTDLQNDKRSLRTGLCKERGIITSAYVTLAPRVNDSSSYMHYLFYSYDICKVFYGMGDGVRQSMNYSDLQKICVLRPAIDEQCRIANYLDTKCSKLDRAIDKKQSLINKLTEYKKSLIYEVVTGKKEV